jgi:hypothetical protein
MSPRSRRCLKRTLVKSRTLKPEYEPKSVGLPYLARMQGMQRRRGGGKFTILQTAKLNQAIELWRQDKEQLTKQGALITRLEERLSQLDSSQTQSQGFSR